MGMTATQLGSTFGRGAKAMNVLLRDHGYLEGEPGHWLLTELGRPFANFHDFDNGYGGYAARSWGWLSWSDGLIDALKASIEANPDGIVSSVPTTFAKAATTDASRHAVGKYKWAVMAAIGVVAVAAPAAKNVRNRLRAKEPPRGGRMQRLSTQPLKTRRLPSPSLKTPRFRTTDRVAHMTPSNGRTTRQPFGDRRFP